MAAIDGKGGLTKKECPLIFLLPIFYFADPSYVSKLLSSQPMFSRTRSFLSFEMFHSTIYFSKIQLVNYHQCCVLIG